MTYRRYNKTQFEVTMSKISDMYHLGRIHDITTEIEKESNMKYYEYVYAMPTRNPAVDFVIYSSISRKDDEMRDNAKDAVRIVMRWATKNGNVYKFLAKHLRIDTLFVNIRKTLVEANENIFNLNYFEFKKLRKAGEKKENKKNRYVKR